jgi:hypothetical protein
MVLKLHLIGSAVSSLNSFLGSFPFFSSEVGSKLSTRRLIRTGHGLNLSNLVELSEFVLQDETIC